METVRTPEDRFENLKDYPYEPRYVEVDPGDGTPLRVHYVDEGQGEIILCLHGQPSFSRAIVEFIQANPAPLSTTSV